MKVLFVDTVHPILKEELTKNGFICQEDYSSSSEEILKRIHTFEGLVIRSRFPLDRNFLSQAQNLKFIARSGSGLENIDLVAAKEFGVEIISSPEGNRDAVAEQALGMLIMLFNNLLRADHEVRKGIWNREKNRGLEIKGKTIGIIGYGVMGKAFAQRLSGFECKVIAYDKYMENYSDENASQVSLEILLKESDVISLHLPYSEETHYYVDEFFIDSCGKDFYLINTARGQHVEIEALVYGLKAGKVKGACLDVLEFEKTSFENIITDQILEQWKYLVASDKVVLSPHIAGWTVESYVKLSTFLAEKILDKFG